MRVVQVGQSRELEVIERPDRALTRREARVDVSFCGICGTDLHLRNVVSPGAVFGHEFAGTVSETGAEVDGWSVGDHVAVLPYTNCGQCSFCRSGNENQCLKGGHNGDVLGVHVPGGYADRAIVDSSSLYALPDSMPLQYGAFTEPVAVSSRAAGTVADLDPQESVVVVGAGPVGVLTGFALQAQGQENIVILEQNPARAEIAESLGFKTVVEEDPTSGLGALGVKDPAAIIECAGSPSATNAALKLLRRQGRLVLVGLPMKRSEIDLDALIMKEIRVEGSTGYTRADFGRAIHLLASGFIPAESMTTGIVSLDETEEAFAELATKNTAHMKVLIQPSVR